jgi:hypothetical protein
MRSRNFPFVSPADVTRLLVVVLGCLVLCRPAHADAFDHYTNPVLEKLVAGKNVKEVKTLTPNDVLDHDRVLPRIPAAFLVVKTNGGRYAKLLVQAAKQKVDADTSVPILLVERFVTYKDGEERTVFASGKGLSLFAGFRLGLDLGQVVPEALGGDLQFVVDGDKVFARPLGKAKLFLVTKHSPDVEPRKAGKFVMGEKFDPKYFNGSFRLHDDGRRSGKVVLKVSPDGSVSGWYYTDKDGSRYEIKGKVGTPQHAIEFTIRFPRTEQTFRGMLFTGNGQAIAGTSKLTDRESGFYAVREE